MLIDAMRPDRQQRLASWRESGRIPQMMRSIKRRGIIPAPPEEKPRYVSGLDLRDVPPDPTPSAYRRARHPYGDPDYGERTEWLEDQREGRHEPDPDMTLAELQYRIRTLYLRGPEAWPPCGTIIGMEHSLWVIEDIASDIAAQSVRVHLRHYYRRDLRRSVSVRS